jgi:aconitate hydratase
MSQGAVNVTSSTEVAMVEPVYARLAARVDLGRERLGRPVTFAEKVLFNHLRRPLLQELDRGHSYANFDPDRVALQDALAQIVVLQFMVAGLDEAVLATTVHCDHLIQAKVGAEVDLKAAVDENSEVYDFLRSACARYGMGFWQPGSGIIHQVVLENYAFPGGMMIGTDSHTPNAGGLGMVAIGVGGGDAIDAMTGQPFNLRWPKLIGVHLSGSLSGWSSAKDVILRVAELLTVAGGTGAMVEYFGPGAQTITATGKATICNMGAEVGATTSIFPFDGNIASYLRANGRGKIAAAADSVADELRADPEVEADPGRFFDQIIEINLSTLEPMINGPDTPDLAHRAKDVGRWAQASGVPTDIATALIGSCTNSSYGDMTRAASIARQASVYGLRAKTQLLITPGSEQIRATIERDGLIQDLEAIGGTVLANACGPCIGQWSRQSQSSDQDNTIVSSFNRNFPKRNDGSTKTKAFVTSPEMVVAYALAGTLNFDPLTDSLVTDSGIKVTLDPPAGDDLPVRGFDAGELGFSPPPSNRTNIDVEVAPTSDRLQILAPFPAWDGRDFVDTPVLFKAVGKCTTDQISAAGPWLRYRGHLENISGNLFLGVVNAFSDTPGGGKDPTGGIARSLPDIAKKLSQKGLRWCAIGDENYGEGSSREHAALEPRYRGCAVIFARSFARIHETNLKKQGILPLSFADSSTYEKIEGDDRITVQHLAALEPNTVVQGCITKPDGRSIGFKCTHTLSSEQIEWFKAGSALNLIARAGR